MAEDENKSKQWSSIFDEFENRLKETAQIILSDLEGEVQQSELYKVQNLMKKTEETKRKIMFQNSILEKIKATVNNSATPWEFDVQKMYEEHIQSEMPQSQSSKCSGTLEQFMNVQKNDEVMISEDGGGKSSYKDPWTRLPIQDPVQSNTCKHYYERSIVFNVLKKKKEFRCPYLGCVQTIKQSNIVDVNF